MFKNLLATIFAVALVGSAAARSEGEYEELAVESAIYPEESSTFSIKEVVKELMEDTGCYEETQKDELLSCASSVTLEVVASFPLFSLLLDAAAESAGEPGLRESVTAKCIVSDPKNEEFLKCTENEPQQDNFLIPLTSCVDAADWESRRDCVEAIIDENMSN